MLARKGRSAHSVSKGIRAEKRNDRLIVTIEGHNVTKMRGENVHEFGVKDYFSLQRAPHRHEGKIPVQILDRIQC